MARREFRLSAGLAVAVIFVTGCRNGRDEPIQGRPVDSPIQTNVALISGSGPAWTLLAGAQAAQQCIRVREGNNEGIAVCGIEVTGAAPVNAALELLPSGRIAVYGVVDRSVTRLEAIDVAGHRHRVPIQGFGSARYFALVAPNKSIRELTAFEGTRRFRGLLAEKLRDFYSNK